MARDNAFYAYIMAQLAQGADHSRLYPNRQPSQVRIQGNTSTPPISGLFGGDGPRRDPTYPVLTGLPYPTMPDRPMRTHPMRTGIPYPPVPEPPAPVPGREYVPGASVPPGWDVPGTRPYEDGSLGVPGAHSDPLLMLLQEWLNRRFPNGD